MQSEAPLIRNCTLPRPICNELTPKGCRAATPEAERRAISYEKSINLKLSANKVYYTACSSLVTFETSCGKLHYQKVSTEFPLHVRFAKSAPRMFSFLSASQDKHGIALGGGPP